MQLKESDLAQRVVWILETLYASALPTADPVLAERVYTRLGSAPANWGKYKTQEDLPALLTEHARQVCTSSTPRCGTCELSKFCQRFRSEQRDLWELSDGPPTVVDLFCGAGGASLGFVQAGFKVLAAVDFDDRALLTYRLNHPELPDACVIKQDLFALEEPDAAAAFRERLLAVLNGRKVDVVVGGPPCQGFSQIGTDGRQSARSLWDGEGIPEGEHQESAFKYDPKNRLYRYFLMIVDWLQPGFCVMENVPAMVKIGNGRVRRQVEQDFHALKYRVAATAVFKAVEYGVPQQRERALFLASRLDVADLIPAKSPRVTLGEAIRDLPALEASTGHEVARRATSRSLSEYALELSQGTALVHNHVARPHMPSDLELYSRLRPGESIKDRPDLAANRELFHYNNKTRFKDMYKRQNYNGPSSTVIAHLSKDGNMYIHPDPAQTRTYTVREAARVQSFPDDYIFCGGRTPQFRQVGNAIPPRFMRPFAELIAALLDHRAGSGEHLVQPRFPF